MKSTYFSEKLSGVYRDRAGIGRQAGKIAVDGVVTSLYAKLGPQLYYFQFLPKQCI